MCLLLRSNSMLEKMFHVKWSFVVWNTVDRHPFIPHIYICRRWKTQQQNIYINICIKLPVKKNAFALIRLWMRVRLSAMWFVYCCGWSCFKVIVILFLSNYHKTWYKLFAIEAEETHKTEPENWENRNQT